MSIATIPDLWPEDIRADVIDPVAILRAQEASLTNRTHGLLRVEVRSFEHKEENTKKATTVIHNFDLIAPVLNEYRITLLRAIHAADLIYPVLVQSRVFDPDFKVGNVPVPKVGGDPNYMPLVASQPPMLPEPPRPDPEYRQAATQDDFIKLITDVLKSSWVRSLIQSLIARSNAVKHDQNGARQEDETSSETSM